MKKVTLVLAVLSLFFFEQKVQGNSQKKSLVTQAEEIISKYFQETQVRIPQKTPETYAKLIYLQDKVYPRKEKRITEPSYDGLNFKKQSGPRTARTADKNFCFWTFYQIGMTVYDIETTFAAVKNGGYEANPILRPFVESGRSPTYVFASATTAASIYASYKTKRKGYDKWWLIPLINGTIHAAAGTWNLQFVFKK